MSTKSLDIVVRFYPESRPVAGKLADAEVMFTSGPLAGLKLVGFAVWERRAGGRNVTFPARQYSINGERRSFALLRPAADAGAQDRFRDLILAAYAEHLQAETAAPVVELGAVAALDVVPVLPAPVAVPPARPAPVMSPVGRVAFDIARTGAGLGARAF